jgi:WD40 repeat protein
MTDPETQRNPVEELAEEFLTRYRRGERPALTEYTRRHPDLADDIRELFPALLLMEEAGAPGPDAAATAPAALAAPRRLGDYRIVREVGRGGMGVVYEAEQEALGRRVALKVLPPALAADATCLRRFRREARSAARLHHSNIVPVFDVGESGGVHYYAMQFIEGQALDAVLRELRRLAGPAGPRPEATVPVPIGPGIPAALPETACLAEALRTGQHSARPTAAAGTPAVVDELSFVRSDPPHGAGPQQTDVPTPVVAEAAAGPAGQSGLSAPSRHDYFRAAARLALQAAEALAYAHGQRILHRDVKPANLLLDLQGTLWVTDFGLAKEEGDDLTRTGAVPGTLRYMAPERFGGVTDARSDVYSLGATLYELLTLRPAFEETDQNRLMRQVLHEEPPRPSQVDARVPRDLETICQKAMAKEPGRRYSSAAALADDLTRFLTDRPIKARRTSLPERAWRWARRHPGWAAATLLLVMFAVSMAAAAVVLRGQLARVRQAEADKSEQLWEARFAGARVTRLGRRPGQRFDSLAALEDLARERPDPRVRDEMAACCALSDLRAVRRWPIDPPGSPQVQVCAFDQDLRLYARLDRAGGLTVHRAADGTLVRRLAGQFEQPVLSPDGHYLAARRAPDGPLVVWRLDAEPPVIDAAADGPAGGADFTPDSRAVVSSGPAGTIIVRNLEGGPPVRLASGRPDRFPLWQHAGAFAVHPDGRRFAVVLASMLQVPQSGGIPLFRTVQVRDLRTGEVKAELPEADSRNASGLAWHPGGDLLAVCRNDDQGGVRLWDVAGKRSHFLPCESGVSRAAFSPAGDLLVSADERGRLSLWEPVTGRLLFTTPARCPGLRFGRDGFLAAGLEDGQAVLWEVVAASDYRTLRHPDPERNRKGYDCCALDPAGRFLAVGGQAGIDLWDIDTGRLRGMLPVKSGCRDLAFEAPGVLLSLAWGGKVSRWQLGDGGKLPAAGAPLDLSAVKPAFANKNTTSEQALYGYSIAASRTLGVTALSTGDTVIVLHRGPPQRPVLLEPHTIGHDLALSPDGRRAATGDNTGTVIKVWDTDSGALVKELPTGEPGGLGFSPDGRWLLTTAGGCRLWDAATWQPGPVLGGTAFAFAADEPRLMAAATGKGAIRLLDPATGHDYVRLEDPDADVAAWIGLSADGGQLIVLSRESRSVHVWDLRAIRRRLDASGLAGDWPHVPRD